MFGTRRVRAAATNFGHRRVVWALLLVGFGAIAATSPPPASAATAPGQVYAFGSNLYGQLGNSTNILTGLANPLPAPIALPGQNGPVTQVAAGYRHSLVVTSSGQLYSFGENMFGQLGTATNSGIAKANQVPALVSLPSGSPPVTEVAAGTDFSLVVTSTGQLYSFGENQFGQLGNTTNNTTTAADPTPTLVSVPGASGPVTEVATGAYFSLAVTSTGQLFAFGMNDRGQLGSPTNNGKNTPNPTPTLVNLPSGSGAVTKIAAGNDFAVALTASGQLYAFGENQFGQLGSTVDNGSPAANPTPELVGVPAVNGPVTQIAAGGDHSLVVTASGQLYAFGENRYGQLGSTVDNGTYAANPTPTAVALPGAIGPVIRIAAGIDSSLAITASGQLYAFGENRYGQLGDTIKSGVFEGANPTPTLAEFPSGTTLGTVGSGPLAYHTLAVVSDLAVTTGSLPAGRLDVPYGSGAAASGGTAPYTWSAGGLPAGLGINSGTGQITGTPTAAGTSAVTLSVTDAEGTTASATLSLAIVAPAAASSGPGAHNPRHCVVPRLTGKKLKTAEKKAKAADCGLSVKSKGDGKGAKAKAGRVVKQNPKAGTVLAAGSKVNVKLRPSPTHKRRSTPR